MPQSGVLSAFNAVGWNSRTFTRSWDAEGNYTGTVPNFHLLSQSIYNCCQSRDELQEGANIDALKAAQGAVTLVGTNQITSSSVNITYVAPDSSSCSLDYSSSDPTLINSFTRVQDGGGARVRNVALSGLTTSTTYYYRVNCQVQQPTGKFATN